MFTEKDVGHVLKFAEMIGRHYAKHIFSNLTRANVSIAETEVKNDTLIVDDSYIQCCMAVKSGIVPRIGKIYNVYVPRMISGLSSEPDDWDYEEIDSTDNIFDALKILYIYKEKELLDSIVECMHFQIDQEQPYS